MRGSGCIEMSLLATVCANLYLLVGSVGCGLGALLTFWLPPRGAWPLRFAVWWARGWLACAGVRLEVELDERQRATLRDGRPWVFLANHQSILDIPVLLAALPVPARFLAKRSLFRIPVFGQALAVAGFIPVDRGDRARASAAFGNALRQLGSGSSVLVFPEETRSPTGEVLPFKRGALLMALRAAVPMVPVGIAGTREVQAKGSLRVRPGMVTVRFGSPRTATVGSPAQRRELLEELRRDVIGLIR
ncbi:MAG TPA: lysophospholipid acyltransferase family protein [Thermoanaerobaculia bacterium]|nr:lysophospholipid acyltransferase family protein [Thermoanaerobaculia bacterium]